MKKITFVCSGNTCRSPMAEFLYKYMDKEEDATTSSRGLMVSPRTIDFMNPSSIFAVHLYNPEVPLLQMYNKRAEKFMPEDMNSDLVLTMSTSHYFQLRRQFGDTDNVFTLRNYAELEGDSIADPFGASFFMFPVDELYMARMYPKAKAQFRSRQLGKVRRINQELLERVINGGKLEEGYHPDLPHQPLVTFDNDYMRARESILEALTKLASGFQPDLGRIKEVHEIAYLKHLEEQRKLDKKYKKMQSRQRMTGKKKGHKIKDYKKKRRRWTQEPFDYGDFSNGTYISPRLANVWDIEIPKPKKDDKGGKKDE